MAHPLSLSRFTAAIASTWKGFGRLEWCFAVFIFFVIELSFPPREQPPKSRIFLCRKKGERLSRNVKVAACVVAARFTANHSIRAGVRVSRLMENDGIKARVSSARLSTNVNIAAALNRASGWPHGC